MARTEMLTRLEDKYREQNLHRGAVAKLQALVDTEDWKMYKELLYSQVMARRTAMFNRGVDSMDAAFAFASDRGEVAGLQLAMQLPEALIIDAGVTLDILQTEIDTLEIELKDTETDNG